MVTRICTKCKETKPLTEFSIKTGERRHYRCKECVRVDRNERYLLTHGEKVCSFCKVLKDRSEFPLKDSIRGKVGSRCLECQRITSSSYYLRNREKVKSRSRVVSQGIRDRCRELITQAKDGPCVDCGRRFPACAMDFDHVRGKKSFNISEAAFHWSPSRTEPLLAEISKCDLVCACCHRVRTWKAIRRSLDSKVNSG